MIRWIENLLSRFFSKPDVVKYLSGRGKKQS